MELGQAYDKIYQYAYFKLHNSHLAEDITQETFLRYLNSSERRGGYEMRYLYTIAKNLCIDAFRKAKHETFAEERIDEPGEDPTDLMLDCLAAREALSKMDEADRELLLLRYVNEESVGTISKLFQCSRFAVYRQTKRAQDEFKRLMGGEGP